MGSRYLGKGQEKGQILSDKGGVFREQEGGWALWVRARTVKGLVKVEAKALA